MLKWNGPKPAASIMPNQDGVQNFLSVFGESACALGVLQTADPDGESGWLRMKSMGCRYITRLFLMRFCSTKCLRSDMLDDIRLLDFSGLLS